MARTPIKRAPPQPTRAAIEAAQRKRMTAKFATRPKTPSTADFDLPAPNDARTERVITPRCTALRVSGPHGAATSVRMHEPQPTRPQQTRPQPKDGAHRSEQWLRNVASLPCVHCGIEGQTQCAHANHRGKGMSLKAPDCWTFPLCVACHREFDQGTSYTKERRRELADEWIIKTIKELAVRGLIRA